MSELASNKPERSAEHSFIMRIRPLSQLFGTGFWGQEMAVYNAFFLLYFLPTSVAYLIAQSKGRTIDFSFAVLSHECYFQGLEYALLQLFLMASLTHRAGPIHQVCLPDRGRGPP